MESFERVKAPFSRTFSIEMRSGCASGVQENVVWGPCEYYCWAVAPSHLSGRRMSDRLSRVTAGAACGPPAVAGTTCHATLPALRHATVATVATERCHASGFTAGRAARGVCLGGGRQGSGVRRSTRACARVHSGYSLLVSRPVED